MISQNTQTHTVMENTLSDVIFEPSEADFEFVDAMCDGLDASFRVPSVEEMNTQIRDAEHFDSLQDYFECTPVGRVAGRVLGWLC